MVTDVAFFEDPLQGLKETFRVLKPGGQLLIGIIDRNCLQIPSFESAKVGRFSSQPSFLSATELLAWLLELGFENIRSVRRFSSSLSKLRK